MSDDKKRDRALQRRVRERQDKTGESYQAAWRRLTGDETPSTPSLLKDQRRLPLPLSTEVPILPGQSAQFTARPQVYTFWPDRLLIKNAGSWTIQQLTVENKAGSKHSLIETADQGAAAFSYATWQPLPAREVLCGEAVVLVVTYCGSNAEGERFEAALFGWEDRLPAKATNRPSSGRISERISERATSPEADPGKTVKLPWTIASPALFVDHVTIANAEDWIINDIRTRGKSIFVQSGDVPAEMFSDAADVILEPLKEGDLVLVLATYIGRESSARLAVELSGTATPPPVPRTLSYFLPVSTSITVLPTQSAQITARPQMAFLPERFVIADSANWIVNDVEVGNASRFAQSGDVPALAFDSRTVGSHVMFGPVQPGQDFIVVTTRSSSCDEGAPFSCGVQGRLVEEHEAPRRALPRRIGTDGDKDKVVLPDKPRLVLPLTPNAENAHRVGPPIPRIPPNQKTRIVVRPLHGAFAIENLCISSAGTSGGSADWIVNEIEIDGRPQRVPKDIPGPLFESVSHVHVSFAGLDVVERDHELALTVTYVGTNPEGIPFFAAATGSRPAQNPTVVPIAAHDPLQPMSSMTIRVSAPSTMFRIERFIIEDGNTGGGSADWIVNDLRIGNRSQFLQSGDIPGDLFATNAIGSFMKFDSWPTDATIEIVVTYIGLREEGALFRARLEGTVVRDDYDVAPPDLSVMVETAGQGAGAVVIATGALFRAQLEGTVVRDDYNVAPPDLSVRVETASQGTGAVVIATCNFRPPATSTSMA